MNTQIKPCPRCETSEHIATTTGIACSIVCNNCYDGAPDAGTQIEGHGLDMVEAAEAWNESVLDYLELNP